jgi:hypothetical protein
VLGTHAHESNWVSVSNYEFSFPKHNIKNIIVRLKFVQYEILALLVLCGTLSPCSIPGAEKFLGRLSLRMKQIYIEYGLRDPGSIPCGEISLPPSQKLNPPTHHASYSAGAGNKEGRSVNLISYQRLVVRPMCKMDTS